MNVTLHLIYHHMMYLYLGLAYGLGVFVDLAVKSGCILHPF